MRITFVLPFAGLDGGVRVIATYARILHARGHEVTVISKHARPSPRLKARLKRLLGRETWHPPVPTPLLDFLGPRHKIVARPGPVCAADLPDADVVIASWWETALWVADLPAAKGRKFYLLQDYEVFHRPREVAATYELGLRMIAVSDYIRDAIMRNHGIADIAVVPNAVDHAQFTAPPRRRGPHPTVGFICSSATRKNVALAVEAVVKAREICPDLRVIVMGNQPHCPFLPDPLPGWISYRHAPPQAEIPALYAACDAWLLTSDHEGFGLPILEAMACRTPVLATRAGAAPQLIDGTNGQLLPSEAGAFAAAIAEIAGMDPADWQALSEAAHATAHGWSWEDATDRLETLLGAP